MEKDEKLRFTKSDVWRILKWMGLGVNIICLSKLLDDTIFVLALIGVGSMYDGAKQGVDVFNYRAWWIPQSVSNLRYWVTTGTGVMFGSLMWWMFFRDAYGKWGMIFGFCLGVLPLIAYFLWELYELVTGKEKEDLGFYVS